MKKSLLTLFALAAMSATALAADIKPAIVYGTGGKFDKSFNEAAYNGAEKFKKETGIAYRDFEPTGARSKPRNALAHRPSNCTPAVMRTPRRRLRWLKN